MGAETLRKLLRSSEAPHNCVTGSHGTGVKQRREFLRRETSLGVLDSALGTPAPQKTWGNSECPQNLSLVTAHEGPQQREFGRLPPVRDCRDGEASSDSSRQSPTNPKCVD